MVKCESLRINMFRITHTGKSVNFPATMSYFTNCSAIWPNCKDSDNQKLDRHNVRALRFA